MVLKQLFLLVFIFCFVGFLRAQVSKSLTVNAGELGTALTYNEKNALTNLTLKGTIDARDFRFIRDELPVLAELDLRAATIVSYSGSGGTLIDTEFFTYPENAIPVMAFWKKSTLTKLVLPQSAKTIQDYAFLDCLRLTSIENLSNINTIGAYAFNNCKSLTSFAIPLLVTRIETGSFFGCEGLKEVAIHESVVSIEENGFMACSQLPTIILPASIISIGKKAFADCEGLKEIFAQRMVPVDLTNSASVFSEVDKNTCILYVPFGTKELYATANQWQDFVHIVEINTLELSPSSLQFVFYGGEDSISVSTMGTWAATTDQAWLTLSPQTGSSNDKLKITVTANEKDTIRTAIVTVTARSAETQQFLITQTANGPAYLLVSASSLSVSSDKGSTVAFTIASNIKWSATSDQYWLTPTDFQKVGDQTIEFSALENTTLEPRHATITFAANGFPDQTFSVVQAPKPQLILMTDTLYIGKEEGSFELFNLTATVAWTTSTNQSWLTIEPSAGDGSKRIKFVVSDNPLLDKRSAVVTFSGIGIDPQYLTVIQVAYDSTLTVSDNTIWLDYGEGNNETVKIFTIKRWTAHSATDWLTISAENFFGDALINLNAQPNPTMAERIGIIEVKAENSFSQFITVTQAAGKFNLQISKSLMEFITPEASNQTFEISSNTNWTVATDQAWITIDNLAGTGNGQVNVKAAKNTTGLERSGFVTVYVANGVSQTVRVVQRGTKVGVAELNDHELTIYPNPFTNGFQISGFNKTAKILLTDLNGRVLLQQDITNKEYIATGALQKGIYFVKVVSAKGTYVQKLIAQ